uniref:Protein arginine methyltransferase NDUFAF7 n=1 Tax=Auxenochlorella protothecoides TaxID=3075 RepID=A0A1D2AAG7_AUXPR
MLRGVGLARCAVTARRCWVQATRTVTSDGNDSTEGHIISIDRSGLYAPDDHTVEGVEKEVETAMARHLKTLIKFRSGPITLAEYMSEVLTNPTAGYYINRDVFGTAGDFITSPEISQMFGEMVGIWCVSTWMQMGSPPRLRIVEMGPGRGTLMADLLRGTAAFPTFHSAIQVDLVEVSPALQALQARALRCGGGGHGDAPGPSRLVPGRPGVAVAWHRSLDGVPQDLPTLFIGHEFIDALPVHQFQKTERGWCERLVDVASPDSPLHLRLVLSPGPTPASRLLVSRRLAGLPPALAATLTQLEVCPQGMAVAEGLARRVAAHGGAALLIDYGQDGPYEASLAAIARHRFRPLLQAPGSADLSARVDFSALRQAARGAGQGVACHGPLTQASFLLGLGMGARLEALLRGADAGQARDLVAGFRRLVGVEGPRMSREAEDAGAAAGGGEARGGAAGAAGHPGPTEGAEGEEEEGMGVSYKAMCISSSDLPVPAPFDVLPPRQQHDAQ